MKITLESTSQIVQLNGVNCRVWEGKSEGGARLTAFIVRVAVDPDGDASELERELKAQRAPSVAWPPGMVL